MWTELKGKDPPLQKIKIYSVRRTIPILLLFEEPIGTGWKYSSFPRKAWFSYSLDKAEVQDHVAHTIKHGLFKRSCNNMKTTVCLLYVALLKLAVLDYCVQSELPFHWQNTKQTGWRILLCIIIATQQITDHFLLTVVDCCCKQHPQRWRTFFVSNWIIVKKIFWWSHWDFNE